MIIFIYYTILLYMKLYLSSYKFGNFTKELADLAGTNKKAAVIMNALDWGDPVRVSKSTEDQISTLNSLGYEAEPLDLRKYFNKSKELKELMSNFGLVWVHGGNSFVLKRAYEQSGFDLIIKELIEENKIIYAGFSAGVVVISPTLRGVEIVDDPNIVPENQNYKKEFSEQCLDVIKKKFHILAEVILQTFGFITIIILFSERLPQNYLRIPLF